MWTLKEVKKQKTKNKDANDFKGPVKEEAILVLREIVRSLVSVL